MAIPRVWTYRIGRSEPAVKLFIPTKCFRSFHLNHRNLAVTDRSKSELHHDDEAVSQCHQSAMHDIRKHFTSTQVATDVGILHALRHNYPHHIIVPTRKSTGLLEFAKAGQAEATLDTSDAFATRFYETDSLYNKTIGCLKDDVQLAKYDYVWRGRHFKLYAAEYEEPSGPIQSHYIIYPKDRARVINGRSQLIDELITAAALFEKNIDNEILVYDRGCWQKSRKLWNAVQACQWEHVILNNEMKNQLVGDVEGFFERQEDYASFAVPWKRGIILHGLPGNGKTISIKALMRSLAARTPSILTLYVKSLGSYSGQDAIRSIFEKAREAAPCLLVFEDLDSLVSESVRSFFLNEVDGLEGNDGIMMVGSTNYLDKLDAGISKRPSRFDRKYHFALPARAERVLYCDYWRSKMSKRSSMALPLGLSEAVAGITEGFSYAYLQEAFVTALLSIVQTQKAGSSSGEASASSEDLEANSIWQAIKKQVDTLRDEMRDSRKSVEDSGKNSMLSDPKSSSAASTGFGMGR